MAKKIRFPLKMKNGAEVRTLDELKASFDLESVLGYFTDGRLSTWLSDRYYDEKAEAVDALSKDLPDLNVKICEILEVDYKAEDESADLEYIQRRNEKYKILSAAIDDQEVLGNMDIVAMDQNELYDILDESPEKVYLYGDKFEIPFGRKNICYIGINNPLVIIDMTKYAEDYKEAGITFINVIFEEGALKKRNPDPIGKFKIKNDVLWKGNPNSEGVCIIPYGVTVIDDYAFSRCNELTSIILPDSVKRIGKEAFGHCINLKNINIPKSVTDIDSRAFCYCESIQSIVIPDSITKIAYGTFSYCKELTSVTLPENITSIGSAAFHYCEKLININIPKSVTTIGETAFHSCYSLKSIAIPDGVEAIEDSTFCYCKSLTSITIPDSVKRIGDSAFSICESITHINIPDNVISIDYHAFSACRGLISIDMPKNLKTIGKGAFFLCGSLKNMIIPDGVEAIEDEAFRDCINLTSIEIPNSVKRIGRKSFDDCRSLTNVIIANHFSQTELRDVFGYTPWGKARHLGKL